MPKSQFIDPEELRSPGRISFTDIPVNSYNKSISEEKSSYKDTDFLRIYHDIAVLREFETILFEIKTKGAYAGIQHSYPGPAHLSLGQEAAAVGQAYVLDKDDYIFGSHRSHSEILAKGLSAIEKLDDGNLLDIMENYFGGIMLKAVQGRQKTSSVKDLAIDFLLYGVLSEILARSTGFTMGLGGSMHAFFLPFGIYPNNAIVGGSATISTGAALYKKVNRKKGIVICNIGDGSLGCGPVWEALQFATMDQFKKLWGNECKGGLPILFNIFNNGYGMGGQTRGETMGYDFLARLGAGINPEQMHAERVDGFNPLAVIDAVRRKKQLLENGKGPILLDVVTYRFTGHSPSDASSYRTKEELEAWMEYDPVITFKSSLISSEVAPEGSFDKILSDVKERMEKICRLVSDTALSPYIDMKSNKYTVEKLMFSNQKIERWDERPCEALIPKEENPRLKQIAGKSRYAFDADGKPVPRIKQLHLRDALFEAILDKFYTDPTLISYGEDVRDWGGAFAVYRGLTEALPYNRLFNSPISEAAIVGSAVGYGLCGGRVIVELM
jgi:2-oxoisovalerate dehydrogenase E1 component